MSCREQLLSLLSESMDELSRARAVRHAQSCDACRDLAPLFEISADACDAESTDPAMHFSEYRSSENPLDPDWHQRLFAQTSGDPCQQAELQLAEELDFSASSPATKTLLQRHLDTCEACQTFAQTQRALDEVLPTMASIAPPKTLIKRIVFQTHGLAAHASTARRRLSAPQRAFELLLARPRIAVEASYVAAVLIWLLFSIPFSSNAWLKDSFSWIENRSQASWSFVAEEDSPIAQLTRDSLDAGKVGLTDFSYRLERRVDATGPSRKEISVASKSLRDAAVELDLRQGSSAVTELTRGIGRLPIQFLSTRNTAQKPNDGPEREMPQGDSE